MLRHEGEALLAAGVACLTIGISVCQFVVYGLLSFLIVPAALVILLMAIRKLRDDTAPRSWQYGGIALLLIGVSALVIVAFATSSVALKMARHVSVPRRPAPEMLDWAFTVFSWLIPGVLFTPGLRLWTNLAGRRCVGWGVVVSGVSPAVLMIFSVLSRVLPVGS